MIIAGGMGGGAVDIFNERNVEVIVGAQGDAKVDLETVIFNGLNLRGIYGRKVWDTWYKICLLYTSRARLRKMYESYNGRNFLASIHAVYIAVYCIFSGREAL